MSDLRDRYLHDLMVDFVREHKLHERVGDLSTWEDFRRKTAVKQPVAWLQREYLEYCLQPPDVNPHGTSGDLREGVHYNWCNDIREGLAKTGVPVHRDVNRIHQLMATFGQSDSADYNSASESTLNLGEELLPGNVSQSGAKPRSKKRELSNHERFMQIKRNLEKINRRRRSRQQSMGK